jgi:hypothetical protein
LPAQFVDAVQAVVAGTNCPACSHPHFLVEPARRLQQRPADEGETTKGDEPIAVGIG